MPTPPPATLENAYSGVVSRPRDSGVKASAQRLAVVISKADILQVAGLRLPSGSRAIADWLAQRGVHNLVLSAPREFAEVDYFMVASQAGGESCPHDPGKPLRWLLRTHGARLPAQAPGRRGQGRAVIPPTFTIYRIVIVVLTLVALLLIGLYLAGP